MFTSIFYSQLGFNGNMVNIFLFGLYGCLCSIGATYIHGIFLRFYYVDKAKFIDTDDEKFENNAQKNLFLFYFWTFLWFWGGNTIFIWQMSYLYSINEYTLQNYWAASFFIAVGLEWLIFDPICAILAGVPALRGIFKLKGYIYDKEVCHHAYKKQKKAL